MAAIGIDLGTTNSCCAVYENNDVCVIQTKEENRVTPSIIFYHHDCEKKVIGGDAIKRWSRFAQNYIYDTKRMIGRNFDDPAIQDNIKNWPFTVKKSPSNECQIEVTMNNKLIQIRPEEVAAEILKKLKDDASAYLNAEVTDAVITVPAYFTEEQRRATKDAAELADLNVLQLISEPTAAALAFAFNKDYKNRLVLVYDLGGGTFDVSLVKFKNGDGEVIATDGHSNLGGRDFDNNLVEYAKKTIRATYNINIDAADNIIKGRRVLVRLQNACRELKHSFLNTTSSELSLGEMKDQEILLTITRETFNEINETLFAQTIQIVDRLLKNAKIEKSSIDDVVLVGGSTRIVRIRELLGVYFGEEKLSHGINPDEAVAFGAALKAAELFGSFGEKIELDYSIADSTPFSLGLSEGMEEKMDILIKKNTTIPCETTSSYATVHNEQERVRIRVYQGEAEFVKDNTSLGEFTITDITPKSAGEVVVEVKFSVDFNNILTVTAKESSRNQTKELITHLENARYEKEEFDEAHQRVTMQLL